MKSAACGHPHRRQASHAPRFCRSVLAQPRPDRRCRAEPSDLRVRHNRLFRARPEGSGWEAVAVKSNEISAILALLACLAKQDGLRAHVLRPKLAAWSGEYRDALLESQIT